MLVNQQQREGDNTSQPPFTLLASGHAAISGHDDEQVSTLGGRTISDSSPSRAVHEPIAPDADTAVLTRGLTRSFGSVRAVCDVDLRIERGTVVGLLGPNGSGKTTLIRMLSTLLRPSSGKAWVAGIDVQSDPAGVRRHIGLTGQYAAVDEFLTGRENIQMMGRLFGLSTRDAKNRADQLLDAFVLSDAADRVLSTYSGGMRRRLDLALSLTGHPEIVFLDEPTTGLDPRSRFEMWRVIHGLVADGTTVLLCTQYLEEADKLAERVVILDQGRVVAEGTPEKLRADIGGQVVEISLTNSGDGPVARATLRGITAAAIEGTDDPHVLRIPVRSPESLADVVRLLDAAGIRFKGLALFEPTLDDVFLALTGRRTEAPSIDPTKPERR
jgi:daunorubicin resistance ABC transporter ATP-binding subunit